LEDIGESMLGGDAVVARVSHAPSSAEGFTGWQFYVWVFLFVYFVF